jgi:hypothetical protein
LGRGALALGALLLAETGVAVGLAAFRVAVFTFVVFDELLLLDDSH